ncbi:MAG: thioredoxin family protein [Vicinamibacteria bacterium]|nr:thioredoxin family protein [Vicinamibacteria bacterium]
MRKQDAALLAVIVALVAGVATFRSTRRGAAAGAPVASAPAMAPAPAALPRMVDIGAKKCIPCKKMAPILAELREEYAGRAEVVFIDVWERPQDADAYRFELIPTQIFFDREGREVWRHEGFLDKPYIVDQFRRMGVE